MNRTAIALSVSILAGLPGAALAQSGHDTHHPASPPAQAEAARASSNLPDFTQAYVDAMNETHGLMMDGVMADDPDVAFVRGMIPHHQGAIDMARIVQQYGDDPQTKAWADQIIAAQEGEIAEMQAWLETNAGEAPAALGQTRGTVYAANEGGNSISAGHWYRQDTRCDRADGPSDQSRLGQAGPFPL